MLLSDTEIIKCYWEYQMTRQDMLLRQVDVVNNRTNMLHFLVGIFSLNRHVEDNSHFISRDDVQ